jgi:hypothetical protein
MSAYPIRRKVHGEHPMNSVATTWTATESLASALAPFSVKKIAKAAETNLRTAENWKAGNNGPSWPHLCRLLHDPTLGPALLTAAGRADIADAVEVLGKLRAAKAALDEIDT